MRINACPECGKIDKVYKTKRIYPKPRVWYIECERCLVRGKARKFRHQAVKAWNKRMMSNGTFS